MGYVDYGYYKSIYGEDAISESDFNRLSWEAEKYVDKYTLGKLKFAFPTEGSAVEDVHRCVCMVISMLNEVEQYKKAVTDGIGYAKLSDGTMKGKVITSVSDGSSTVGFSSGGSSVDTNVAEMAKSGAVLENEIYKIIRKLDYTKDANGVYLTNRELPYPGKRGGYGYCY